MPTNPDLARTQRWLQNFIIEPGTDEQALASESVKNEYAGDVSRMVIPSKTLTSAERAGVYRGMYLLRMEEALTTDYPVLKIFLGDDAFFELISRYVEQYPSRSHSLNFLGRSLPKFIGESTDLADREFLNDLAAFELAIAEVFDEEQTPVLSPEEIAKVPEETWETARLKSIAALRLCKFNYPVSTFKEAYRDDESFPEVSQADQWLAVYRRDYRVYWTTLDEPGYDLLGLLAKGGVLGEAIERVCLKYEGQVGDEEIFSWFQDWMSQGLFQSVDTS
jgi:hypothetical protein